MAIGQSRRSWFRAGIFVLGGVIAATLAPRGAEAVDQEEVLHSFCAQSGCPDGYQPYAAPIRDAAGNLYGTTYEGGTHRAAAPTLGGGTVFELMPPAKGKTAWTQKVLYSFCAQGGTTCTDGAGPRAGLIADAAGNLYGSTTGGGLPGSSGTVFELTPPAKGKTAWTQKVLYSFCAQLDCTDGANPYAGLIRDAAGNLYGTTCFGGTFFSEGTVFELTPPAAGKGVWTENVLYSFCPRGGNCADGAAPTAGLIMDAAGNLYGTTTSGGSFGYADGTAFELTPPTAGKTAWTHKLLYSFCARGGVACTDGQSPSAGVIRDAAGNLYGATQDGGAHFSAGTVFELSPPARGETAWKEKVLYSFCAQLDCTDGANPYAGPGGQIDPGGALIRDASGNLYGTTSYGGAHAGPEGFGGGTVFELTPPAKGKTAWTEKVLYSLCAKGGGRCTDGSLPTAGLIMDASGNLYGTTNFGGAPVGAFGGGTVFELTP
jgi:hypothetical protein